jgi:hypothetical protein
MQRRSDGRIFQKVTEGKVVLSFLDFTTHTASKKIATSSFNSARKQCGGGSSREGGVWKRMDIYYKGEERISTNGLVWFNYFSFTIRIFFDNYTIWEDTFL